MLKKTTSTNRSYHMPHIITGGLFPLTDIAYITPNKDGDGISMKGSDREPIAYFDFSDVDNFDGDSFNAVLRILNRVVIDGNGVPKNFDWGSEIENEMELMISENESKKPQGKKKNTENTSA